MKEAKYILGNKCYLCQRNCVISSRGFCNVRVNINGKIYSLVYGEPTGFQIDPIEKKPFFHFRPGMHVLSFGTQGCNFRCPYCCNYFYSQAVPDEKEGVSVPPEEVVDIALKNNCEGIAYTYNEPTIFFEYAYDIAKLARKHKLFNVFVTNGSTSKEPIKDISLFLDAVVIDFKGFSENSYKFIGAKLEWVKNCVKYYSNFSNIHKEITYLVIPGHTDNKEEIKNFGIFIRDVLGLDTPIHLLKFYPLFKARNIPETPIEMLSKCKSILEEMGFYYVYLGNVGPQNTYCPKCGTLLIERGYEIKSYLKDRACPNCGFAVNIK